MHMLNRRRGAWGGHSGPRSTQNSTDDIPTSSTDMSDATPPAETLGPPSWLDARFFEAVLAKNASVTSLRLEDAVGKGENYATVVYRALVDTPLGTIPLIVKCVPENEFMAKIVEDGEYMLREVRMYERTLPLLRGSLSKPSFPPCLHSLQEKDRKVLVLQDMRPLGYRTSNRQLGLDAAHCRLVLTELAHLHGLSAAMRVKEPAKFKSEIQDLYFDIMYSENCHETANKYGKSTLTSLAEFVDKNLPFRFKEISKLMLEVGDTSFDDLKRCINYKSYEDDLANRVLVLTHGDCWSNNMLFKYEDGRPEPLACCLVDFQIARCASPVLDLFYFLFTSTTQATRRAHMDGLLTLYLDEARKAMRERGVDDPGNMFYKDMADLKKDMDRHMDFGFIFLCMVLPIAIADKSAAPDMEVLTAGITDSNPFAKLHSGKLFCDRFREFIEDFDDMGYFLERSKRVK